MSRRLSHSEFIHCFTDGVGEIVKNLYSIEGEMGRFEVQVHKNPEDAHVSPESAFENALIPASGTLRAVVGIVGNLANCINDMETPSHYPAVVRSSWMMCLAGIVDMATGVEAGLIRVKEERSFDKYADETAALVELMTKAQHACAELSRNVQLSTAEATPHSEIVVKLCQEFLQDARRLRLLPEVDTRSREETKDMVLKMAAVIRSGDC